MYGLAGQRPAVVRLEDARRSREARKLPLRRLPSAADARPRGLAHDAGCSSSPAAASTSTASASESSASRLLEAADRDGLGRVELLAGLLAGGELAVGGDPAASRERTWGSGSACRWRGRRRSGR